VLAYGKPQTLEAVKIWPGERTVYNLEVGGVHNFLVGDGGMVVHNGCWKSIKDIFDIFNFSFVQAILIDKKKWVHKVTPQDNPIGKEVEFAEYIGEHLQEKIAMTKAGTAGIDAFSENGRIMSFKIMEGITANSNVNNLLANINGGISLYEKAKPAGVNLKVEIWIKGDHATRDQIQTTWNAIKDLNVRIQDKKDLVSKIFYLAPDGLIELIW
jgi:hypothetical protein